jgi:hypothetical protein
MHPNRNGEAVMESKVLELVVFKLAPGVSREQFLGTADGLSDWVGRQPGFISRELSHDAEGDRWIEVVWWKTMADAKAAAELAMTSESWAPMFAADRHGVHADDPRRARDPTRVGRTHGGRRVSEDLR